MHWNTMQFTASQDDSYDDDDSQQTFETVGLPSIQTMTVPGWVLCLLHLPVAASVMTICSSAPLLATFVPSGEMLQHKTGPWWTWRRCWKKREIECQMRDFLTPLGACKHQLGAQGYSCSSSPGMLPSICMGAVSERRHAAV